MALTKLAPMRRGGVARRSLILALAVSGLVPAGAGAATGPRAVVAVPARVAAGGTATVIARVPASRRCRLTVAGAEASTLAVAAGRMSWRWRVPRVAKAGRYEVRLTCDGTTRRTTVRIRGRRRGGVRRLAVPPIRVSGPRVREPGRQRAPNPAPASPAPSLSGPAVPRNDGGVLFGVHSPPAPAGGLEAIDTLERTLGRRIAIVLWYQHWDGWAPELHPEWSTAVSASGRLPLLTWEPWRPDSADQPAFRLQRIADGAFDGYVRRWARGLAALGTTVYLRPMHEMNGTWYPWGGATNGNSPEAYRRAWRHLHDVFARAGATNVRWVWSPNADDVPARPDNELERYYPGEKYVDVLAMDGYNWGAERPEYGGWRSFEEIFDAAYARLAALGPQPIWVAETASDGVGGDKAEWVRDMFAAARRLPRLQAVVWFDVDKERDWRATFPAWTAAAFSPAPW